MNIINHTDGTGNPAPTSLTPHPLAATLAARMNAGAHERCPACLSWIAKNQVGAIAIYIPHDNRPQVAYALCRKCARAINGTPTQQTTLTRKIEQYLDGVTR